MAVSSDLRSHFRDIGELAASLNSALGLFCDSGHHVKLDLKNVATLMRRSYTLDFGLSCTDDLAE
jgi:hypothetical protein